MRLYLSYTYTFIEIPHVMMTIIRFRFYLKYYYILSGKAVIINSSSGLLYAFAVSIPQCKILSDLIALQSIPSKL